MNVDCRKIEQLISPYLDGELSRVEADAVGVHLSACTDCRRQYEDLLRLSEALRSSVPSAIPAPDGLAAAIMAQIKEEHKVIALPEKNPWFKRHWRQALAGVAAAAMLMFSTILPNSGPLVQIADNPPSLVQPDNPSPDIENPGTQPGIQPIGVPDSQNPGTGTGDPGSIGSDSGTQIAQNPEPVDHTPLVLLNKDRALITTLLEVKARDASQAQQQAARLAADVKAQVQNLGQQVNDNGSHTVLKITVAKSQAARLISGLEGMGALNNKEVTKTDINSQFANKLSQYQNLLTQRANLKDTTELAELDVRIQALETELKNWDQQADQETIILWLQK